MRRLVLGLGVVVMAAVAALASWRRHPRVGTRFVNMVVDPWLVRRGIVARSGGELGVLEHVGRRSGVVRLSPVHPVRTETGFRVIVPLGAESQWARNVLAAGHCRLRIGDIVYDLDEPALVVPSSLADQPRTTARLMDWLGFRYLVLHSLVGHTETLGGPASAHMEEPTELVLAG